MKNKIPYLQRTFRGKFKYSMLFFVLLLSVTVILWIVTIRCIQLKNIAKNNEIVDARIIGYDVIQFVWTEPFTIEINYRYQYEDENGVIYSGHVGSYYVNDLETADKTIENGQTIRIYIDGKGNSFPANTDISQKKETTILVFSIILTVGTVVFFIIFLIPLKDKTER